MNAATLKREIETLLGLSPLDATILWRTAAPTGPSLQTPQPVPIPFPNIATAGPVNVQGADSRFDGKYVITGVQHRYGESTKKHLFECIRAAAAGDQSAQRVEGLWLQVKQELGRQPSHVRHQFGHELTHTVQQRG